MSVYLLWFVWKGQNGRAFITEVQEGEEVFDISVVRLAR